MRILILTLFFLMSNAYAITNNQHLCQSLLTDKETVFASFKENNHFLICIHQNKQDDEYARINFYKKNKNGYQKIAENNRLIYLDDVKLGAHFIDVYVVEENKFQLFYQYPKTKIVISLMQRDNEILIENISKDIRLNTLDENDHILSLSLFKNFEKKIKFEEANLEQLLERDGFQLFPGKYKARITSHKAYLLNSPDSDDLSKMYLIENDLVDVLQYKNNYLKISYKKKNGHHIKKWISMIDIL